MRVTLVLGALVGIASGFEESRLERSRRRLRRVLAVRERLLRVNYLEIEMFERESSTVEVKEAVDIVLHFGDWLARSPFEINELHQHSHSR